MDWESLWLKKRVGPPADSPQYSLIPSGYYKQVLGMIVLLLQQVQILSTFGFVGGIQKFETAFNVQVRDNYRLDYPLCRPYSKVKISLRTRYFVLED